MPRSLSFEYALTPGGIEANKRLLIEDNGVIVGIEDAPGGPFDGYFALPGMPNAHSHSFQRLLRGFGEVAATTGNFWSWRDTMYHFASRVTARDLYVVARMAFAEMLRSGFTSVGEFHYLHHSVDGTRGPEMARSVAEAAAATGIRLRLFPVFYVSGGIGQDGAYLPLARGQRRFAHATVGDFLALVDELDGIAAGFAAHSLRAVPPEMLADLVAGADKLLGPDSPLHIHVSEQPGEVRDCDLAHKAPPIRVLSNYVELGPRWNLVHATHATDEEMSLVIAAGANVILCPLTEAYLGDGVFPVTSFLAGGGHVAIGSDSNVRIDPVEELRWLEYGQRLKSGERPCLAGPEGLGGRLWRECAVTGANALGVKAGAIELGRLADFVVLPESEPIAIVADKHRYLDALLTGLSAQRISDVYVGGRRLISNGALAGVGAIRREFAEVIERITDDG